MRKIIKIPYIITIHGLFYPSDLLFSACTSADEIIAVSEPVKKFMINRFKDVVKGKLFVVPNGVDIPELLTPKEWKSNGACILVITPHLKNLMQLHWQKT